MVTLKYVHPLNMGLKLVSLKYDTHWGLFYFPSLWWGWKVTTDVKETTNLVEIALETCKKIPKKVVTTMHEFSPKRRNADTHPALVWNRSLLNIVPTQHPFENGHWKIWYPPNTTWDCNWTLWNVIPTPTLVWTLSEKAPQAIPAMLGQFHCADRVGQPVGYVWACWQFHQSEFWIA